MALLIALFLNLAGAAYAAPDRIVTTFVGADEILWELLGDTESHRIAGLSTLARDKSYSDYWDKIPKTIPVIGSSNEFLLSLRPDLVITASFTRADILNLLKKTRTPHIVLSGFRSSDDIVRLIQAIGEAIGREAAAKKLSQDFLAGLTALSGKCGSKRRFLSYSSEHLVYGKNTTFDSLIRAIGGVNSAEGVDGFAQIGTETLVGLNPDFVVAAGREEDKEALLAELKKAFGWQNLIAIRKGRLIMVPSRYLSSVSHTFLKGAQQVCHEARQWRW